MNITIGEVVPAMVVIFFSTPIVNRIHKSRWVEVALLTLASGFLSGALSYWLQTVFDTLLYAVAFYIALYGVLWTLAAFIVVLARKRADRSTPPD